MANAKSIKATKPILLCFPGFLGLKSDFDFLNYPEFEKIVVDLCGKDAPFVGQSWHIWQTHFLKLIDSKIKNRDVVLVGYSMGARVALGILALNPLWAKAAVLISCRDSLDDDSAKEKRAQSDLTWANRFKHDPWLELMRDWDSQDAFDGSSSIKRLENNYRRTVLANALETFSLSRQKKIAANSINLPVLLCWGQKDEKFKEYAGLLSTTMNKFELLEIAEAGHRAIFDNPMALQKSIESFIKQHLQLI